MATMTKAYVDTSALIAFRDRSDSFNSLFVQLFSNPPPLVTTPLVIAEGQGWFLRRYDRGRAFQFLDFIEKLKCLTIIPIGKKELTASKTFIQKFSDQRLTLTDACGLWLMKKMNISSCWSTDRHLSLTGKKLVIHEI